MVTTRESRGPTGAGRQSATFDPAHDVDPGPVAAGALIGRDGFGTRGAGNSEGPHLHLIYRNASTVLNPFDLWGGQSAMENEGFAFNDSDPTTCEEPE